ncbi:Tic20 family protein [Prochlorothrix hollandica]|nr:Tic20 family protein [Prochlorothrix hollandica]
MQVLPMQVLPIQVLPIQGVPRSMAFSGSASPSDRAFSALAYLLPLSVGILSFSAYAFRDFPFLQILAIPALPVLVVSRNLPFGDFLIFLGLLFFVIRNPKVSYFIRFNVMQSILLDIALVLGNLILGYLLQPAMRSMGSAGALTLETFSNMFFLATIAAVAYGVFRSVQGNLADEIPAVSEAARIQTRY